MPSCPPPKDCPGVPVIEVLPRGTPLHRIHLSSYAGNAFNPRPATSPVKGSRFDHTTTGEGFLYAGETLEVAVAEILLRGLPPQPAPRIIPAKSVQGRLISELRTLSDTNLVSLRGRGLSQLGQDAWLTSCDEYEYALTREWATAIRRWVPTANGFEWRSRRYQEEMAYVFYETRTKPAVFDVVSSKPADSGTGLDEIEAILQEHLAVLA